MKTFTFGNTTYSAPADIPTWANSIPSAIKQADTGQAMKVANEEIRMEVTPPELVDATTTGYLALSGSTKVAVIMLNSVDGSLYFPLPCIPIEGLADDEVLLPKSIPADKIYRIQAVPVTLYTKEIILDNKMARWNEGFKVHYNLEHGLFCIAPQCQIVTATFINKEWTAEKHGIAGLDNIINEVITELFVPYLIDRPNVRKPRGLLLYGPPGNGKTLIARAIAALVNTTPVVVNGGELRDKYVGQSEANLRNALTPSDTKVPHVVIIDEIDALVGIRSSGNSESSGLNNRMVTEILTALDGFDQSKRIIIIGTTNRKDAIDPAILRPGRMGIHKYIPLPNAAARKNIILHHLSKHQYKIRDVEIIRMATQLEAISGAEIADLISNVARKKITGQMSFTLDSVRGLSYINPDSLEDPVLTWADFKPYIERQQTITAAKKRVIYLYRTSSNHGYATIDMPRVQDYICEIFGNDYSRERFLELIRRIENHPFGASFIVSGSSKIFFRYCEQNGYTIIQDA